MRGDAGLPAAGCTATTVEAERGGRAIVAIVGRPGT
jgi:hypothetical protein